MVRSKRECFKVQTRSGRKMGRHGTRIQITDMNKIHKSETITVHNMTPQQLKPKIKFFLEGIEYAEENETDVVITYTGGGKSGEITYNKAEVESK